MSKNHVISFSDLGPLVDVGDGQTLPSRCRAFYGEIDDDPRSPAKTSPLRLTVVLELELVGNAMAIKELVLAGTDQEPHVTPAVVRALRLQEILERVAGSLAVTLRHSESRATSLDEVEEAGRAAAGTRRRLTPQLLGRVAQVVRNNPDQPTKEVASQLFTSHRNATRWIAEARRQGYIKEDGR